MALTPKIEESNTHTHTHTHPQEGEHQGPQVLWEANTSGADPPQRGQAQTCVGHQAVWDMMFSEISQTQKDSCCHDSTCPRAVRESDAQRRRVEGWVGGE